MNITTLKKQTTIIYFFLMSTRVVFAYIMYAIIAPSQTPTDDRTLVYVLFALAAVEAFVAYFISLKAQNPDFIRNSKLMANKQTMIEKTEAMTDKEYAKLKYFAKFQSVNILSWAIAESMAIFGVIAPILGGTWQDGLGLIIASTAVGFMLKPNYKSIPA